MTPPKKRIKRIIKKKVAKKKVAKRKVVKKKTTCKVGRPTAFKPEYSHITRAVCKLGATDGDLAEIFKVTKRTIHSWKKQHPDEFLHPLKVGKAEANENVKQALYSRALGYSHNDTDIRTVGNRLVKTKIIKHYPPETAACIFFLSNRDPDNWKRNGMDAGENDNDIAKAFLKLASVLPD